MTTKIIADGQPRFDLVERTRLPAMWRGFRCKCPACGKGKLFGKYLKVVDRCSNCGEELHHQRADDAPAYFTITTIAHIFIPAVFAVELIWQPSYWIHLVLWLPSILIATFWLMPRVKGAIIGLQWALRMHGFGGPEPEEHELDGFSGQP